MVTDIQSKKDAPSTQREYETIYILQPEVSSDQIQQLNERVRRAIETSKGKPVKVENWGKRKLAYKIKKQTRGVYLYWRYLALAQTVAEVERNLRMSDTVMRFLTVKIDENVDPNARPSDVTEEALHKAATEIPIQEEVVAPEPIRSRDEFGGEGDDYGMGDFDYMDNTDKGGRS